ncbi:hypothetical protein NLK61_15250 [Pseudomonas fuscovaginae UPB0736]|uniref:Uncharacterized protein n=1 Tax=Pseudomonas asplenii TaxID=53407 RepID=A0A1H1SUP6_9PSED|nr:MULTISPECIES: hypothetical protein [Pseudomonas]UUQ62657.1 hypothetical protein NLK61_15250 [Pseudomonas fuscovaginae UPB0736]UZE28836.1 hypothetical protein LOY63_26630 [Pseudomonas asplenii]SDS51712.1 hypothetical protein SAMN05216598_1835 [Pseudomonas asplenii]SEH96109.1 hypothetical protein SAMN05216581_0836 [Pseudomonas fuscovaginae]
MEDVKQQDNAPQEMTLEETMEIRGAGWGAEGGEAVRDFFSELGQFFKHTVKS